jgi:hypothetical protein
MVHRFYAGRDGFCRLTPPAHSLVQERRRVLTSPYIKSGQTSYSVLPNFCVAEDPPRFSCKLAF